MELASGNISAAARMAGKERRALGKLLQKYHIQKPNHYPMPREHSS
jgi:DNA-binding protein Fis